MTETIKRISHFGFQNYLRNGWLSLAATFVVAMTLFIISFFLLQTYTIRSTTESVANKLDMSIYINDTPSEEDVATFIAQIKTYPEVKEVTYLNKSQVMDEWNKLHVDEKIKSQVNEQNNPLPRTIKVKAYDPEQLQAIVDNVNKTAFEPNIQNISYRNNRPIIQRLAAQSKQTTRKGIIVSTIFVLITIVFVYNTIRIIIRFRQDEISIMKLVGATDAFVHGPFLVEGALYGVVAGVLTFVALYFYLQNGLSDNAAIIGTGDSSLAEGVFQLFRLHGAIIAGLLSATGVFLAVACSWISVRLHLKH